MLYSKKIKDIKNRILFKQNEILTTSLKFINTNFLNKNKKLSKIKIFDNIKQKNFSKVKIVRRCILNNRARGSIRPFNVSRVKLRELFQFGMVPGYKKSI
jgi:ribosomal protein S14